MASRFPALPGHKPEPIDDRIPWGWKAVLVFLQLLVIGLGVFMAWMCATDLWESMLDQFRNYGPQEGIPFAFLWSMLVGGSLFLLISGISGPASHRWFWTNKPVVD